MRYRDFSQMSDRSNHRLNVEIERQIDMLDGTIHGQTIKNMRTVATMKIFAKRQILTMKIR